MPTSIAVIEIGAPGRLIVYCREPTTSERESLRLLNLRIDNARTMSELALVRDLIRVEPILKFTILSLLLYFS